MSTEKAIVSSLVSYLIEGLKDDAGRVRVEELLSVAASVVGERCIEAAGEFDPRTHSFMPGERVFSETVNELLTGNVSSQIADVPSTSVFGIIRDTITTHGYHISEFPALDALFAGFAGRIGDPVDWGRVPLSVPDENKPYLIPLRVAYETRRGVDHLLSVSGGDAKTRLRLVAQALGETLVAVAEAIDRKVALLLTLETVNGMAKTAPMTDKAFQSAVEGAGIKSPESPQKKPWWQFW